MHRFQGQVRELRLDYTGAVAPGLVAQRRECPHLGSTGWLGRLKMSRRRWQPPGLQPKFLQWIPCCPTIAAVLGARHPFVVTRPLGREFNLPATTQLLALDRASILASSLASLSGESSLSALSLGPTRGVLPSQGMGHILGRLYGPANVPFALAVLHKIVDSGWPVIAGSGV